MTVYDGTKNCDKYTKTETNWKKQICAGDIDGKDTCKGDSGGPLYIKGIVNNKTKYILVGITSYGESCGLSAFPG